MSRRGIRTRMIGFTLLPVILTMSLIGAIAFLLNRDNGMNAAMIADWSDAERARYAAEAGLQAVNAIVQTKNCTGAYPSVGTPVTNSSFGGASYSAYANPASGNTTTLTSTGAYSGTSVTLTRNNAIAYQSAPKTYTLQPGPAAGFDSYIVLSSLNNNGNDPHLQVKPNQQYALLKFDLSAFPAGSLPLSANIALYVSGLAGGPHTVSLYRLSNDWQEGTGSIGTGVNWFTRNGLLLNWATPGGDYHPVAVDAFGPIANNAYNVFQVTDLAKAWLRGSYPNYGVILASGATTGNFNISSSDDAANKRPKLSVNYLVPCGAIGPSDASGSVTLNPVADALLDGQFPTTKYGNAVTFSWNYVDAGNQRRAVLRFDTSSIPPGTLIQSATLRIDVTGVSGATGNPKTISAYALTEAFTEGSVTWSKMNGGLWQSAGGTYQTPSVAMATEESSGTSPPPGTFTTGWLTWDLKALTQEWIDGVTANNGVILISTVPDQHTAASREDPAGNGPQLVITW